MANKIFQNTNNGWQNITPHYLIRRTKSRSISLGLFGAIMLINLQLGLVIGQQQRGDEICETLPSDIHLIKEEYDELGRLERTCNGEVQVNKCEGLCNSQVQPSVITPTGFLKECYCCRENYLRERLVTLTHCYDPDGNRLTTSDIASMDIRLKEPAECRCTKCGDFSR